MKDVYVIYWSGTGNTEAMAQAGAAVAGGEGVIANNAPDDQALEACRKLGEELAK